MKKLTNKEYSKLVEKYSPKSPIKVDVIRAFIIGGALCSLGQIFRNFYSARGLGSELSATATSISLIFIAAVLTAFNIFDNIAKYAGAGTLVPITGFSNSVVSPAMEFKTEGFVLGTASRMFIVAGPVIVYGTVSSIIAGLIYYFIK